MNTGFFLHIISGFMLFLSLMLHAGSCRAGDQAGSAAVRGDYPAVIEQCNQQLSGAPAQQRVEILIRRGEAYRALGYYRQARKDFQFALDAALTMGRPLLVITAMQALGYVCFLQQEPDMAEQMLHSALKRAEALDQPALAAACANHLGIVLFNQDRREDAQRIYQRALAHVERAHDPGLAAGIRLNYARILIDNEQAKMQLQIARTAARTAASPYERAGLLLGIAAEAQHKKGGDEWSVFIFHCLKEALSLAVELGEPGLCSRAAGELGAFYEENGNLDRALELTRQALQSAQGLLAHELLLQLEWQMGRILRAQGHREQAIASYKRAVFHVQAIRSDIPIQYQDGRSSFREMLAPIYLGLADMLLQQAAQIGADHAVQDLLRQARDAVEQIKRSEIQDYFRDSCIAARSRLIESISLNTAVIYPIILPDRLELLVDIAGRLYRKTSFVTKERMEREATLLAFRLRNELSFKQRSRSVYGWLLAPIISILEENRVDTLVFVPDGVLRLLPVSALWDGKRYLVERYAVADAPGLSLLEPGALPREDTKALLAGLSHPGPVVFDLPQNLWHTLGQTEVERIGPGLRGVPVKAEQLRDISQTRSMRRQRISERQEQGQVVEQVKENLALPGVAEEIERLTKQFGGRTLLDREFEFERFWAEFKEQPYSIVHIASHGYFAGAPEQSFIMTYDRILNMNQLESLIKPRQLAAEPVELITFSACQTAEGDDRSPLGLTGVALKSGARSALGALWPVADTAALELLPAFYTYLLDSQESKAKALQQAQVDLLKTKRFEHPFYWAAFILVGNWL